MKFKSTLIIILVVMLSFSISYAELGPKAFSFSKLTGKAVLIVSGTVSNVLHEKENYIFRLNVSKFMKGRDESEITVYSRLSKGAFIEDEYYPEENDTAILFLFKDKGKYSVVNGIAGYTGIKNTGDIEQLLAAIGNNHLFFSGDNKEIIKDLYLKLNNIDCKTRLLHDLIGLLNVDDSGFISSLLEREEISLKILALQQAGKIQSVEIYPLIKRIITEEKNEWLLKYAVSALGQYRNPDDLDVFVSFLDHPRQGIRFAAIESLGLLEDSGIIEPLTVLYEKETDRGNRYSVIEAVSVVKDKTKRNKALDYFESIEKNHRVKKYIKEKKQK